MIVIFYMYYRSCHEIGNDINKIEILYIRMAKIYETKNIQKGAWWPGSEK